MISRRAFAALALLALAACDDSEDTAAAPPAPVLEAAGPAAITAVSEDQAGDRYRRNDLVVGALDAPIAVFAFESLTCPHCASFHQTSWPALKAQFVDTGQVAFVFRDMPLDGVALRGSALASCLPAERRYGLLQLMFDRQSDWARGDDPVSALAGLAAQAGMPRDDALACMNDAGRQNAILQVSQSDARSLGVRSTPSFVIDGAVVFQGAPATESFAAELTRRLGG